MTLSASRSTIRAGQLAALLALALGAGWAVAVAPLLTAAVAAGLVAAVAAALAPVGGAIAGLTLLVVGPQVVIGESVGPIETEAARKTLILLLFAPAVARSWLEARYILPVLAYGGLAALTFAQSATPPELGAGQVAATFVSLSLGWVILAIRWKPDGARRLLLAVMLLPLVCVGIGAVLALMGIGFWYGQAGGGTVGRLGGATIPPQLAMLGVTATSAAILAARATNRRGLAIFAAVNAAIVGLTLTRGAIAAAAVLFLPIAARYLWSSGGRVQVPRAMRAVLLVAIVGAVAAVLIPPVTSRGEAYSVREGGFNTSGRSDAWRYFWDKAQVDPVFGRGLGAGPIIGENVPRRIVNGGDFTAQHNEYLRMYLEGGYVGFGLVLAAVIAAVTAAGRAFPRRLRADGWALIAAFALLSFVDNTMSSPEFIVSFAVVAGAARALREREVESDDRKQLA